MITSLFKLSGKYLGGLFVSKFLSTAVFVIYARQLLPSKFGEFIFYLTLLQIITFFADFGLNLWYQKKARRENREYLFYQILCARIFTLSVSILLAGIYFLLVPGFNLTITILFLISLFPEALLSIIDGYYLEKEMPVKVSLKMTIKMIVLLLGFFFFPEKSSLEFVIFLYFIGSLISLLMLFPHKIPYNFKKFNFSGLIRLLHDSSHYAFLIFTSFFYARGDHLIIQYSVGSFALGIYGASYRFLDALSLIPTALAHNLFPISAKDKGLTLKQLLSLTSIMLVLGLIFSFFIFIMSDFIIYKLLGASFGQASLILRVFAFVLILFFINSPLSTVVQSSSYIKKFLPYGIINTVLNILLNIILIPIYGVLAAAWVMLFTEITGFFINLYFVKLIYKNK